MKVRDLLSKEVCVDVIDDVTDDLWIAFEGPVELTIEGEKKFASILDLPVEFRNGFGGVVACILIDDRKDWERLERKCIELFEGLAGYCSVDKYNRWFIYESVSRKKSTNKSLKKMNEANKDPKLGSVEDYLDKLNHCKSKSEAEKILIKAAGNPNASEAYRRWKVMKGLDESKKRIGEGFELRHDASNKLFDICNELYVVLEDYQSELVEANVYDKIKKATDNIFDFTELFSPGKSW